jgi:hypothetical protein
MMSAGKSFQIMAPATGKAQPPALTSLQEGTTTLFVWDDLSRARDCTILLLLKHIAYRSMCTCYYYTPVTRQRVAST